LPGWVALSCPEHFEQAVRFNPIVKSCINLLASSASNGEKYLIDSKTGEEIPWSDTREVVQKIKKLIIERPNPNQSGKEFEEQSIFYLKTFGNNYVYGLMPSGFDSKLDIMNIEALYNLPSQFIQVNTTGKVYNQTKIEGIISEYARTNTNPVDKYKPSTIMHYNEVNVSSEQPLVMGISKLESLRYPISNTQACFQAMDTLLREGGARGILSVNSKDGTGVIVPLQPTEKKEVQKTFKEEYGLQKGQSPFLISNVPLDYQKIAMTAKELGVYEELSSNSLYISNELGIPVELIKTDVKNSTFENQSQSVKRLYQDTTIPMVAARDQYTNQRLQLGKYDVILKTRWDHIPALAENEKDKAMSNNLIVKAAIEEYNTNLITFNQYLTSTNKPPVDDSEGKLYKWQRDAKIPNANTNNE